MTESRLNQFSLHIRQAAEGIDHLHRNRVFHRDIKPENILLVDNVAKVADFGLAKFAKNCRSTKATFAGSAAYCAPEVWSGRITSRSDQYSLAVTFAELRLGHRVFSGSSYYEYMIAHQQGLPDLSSLPNSERLVLTKAISKSPDDRFETCVEFAIALQDSIGVAAGVDMRIE